MSIAVAAGRGNEAASSETQTVRKSGQLVGGHGGVVRECRGTLAEDVVADPPARDVGADHLYGAGKVGAGDGNARAAQPEAASVEEPGKAGLAAHDAPVAGVDRRSSDPYQHLFRTRSRSGDGAELEDVR
jgi:hypothetical protein